MKWIGKLGSASQLSTRLLCRSEEGCLAVFSLCDRRTSEDNRQDLEPRKASSTQAKIKKAKEDIPKVGW